jgi:ubiquinol-cytochrome c reductase cytochrome b subunit
VLRHATRWLDRNIGEARRVRRMMRHIFPDHWSFFFGEIALYSSSS